LAFGIAAATLLFLCVGVERFPVTHHVALVSSLSVVGLAGGAATPAAVAGEVGLLAALLVGAAFGVVTALAGELAQRVLYAHADTHVDPPAAAIVVGSFLVALLDVLGVFQQSALPTLGL
jgi:predicted outer membrane lipoprotein